MHRWFKSGWGRYTQADPIGLAGGLNLYGYVDDNPVRFFDPFGLISPVKPQNQKWRECNPSGEARCKASGKYGMESCMVSRTFRAVRVKNRMVVRAWVDGPMSCSCNEPSCWERVKDWLNDWAHDPSPAPPLLPLPPFLLPPVPEPVIPGLPPFFINPCMLKPSLCDKGPGGIA